MFKKIPMKAFVLFLTAAAIFLCSVPLSQASSQACRVPDRMASPRSVKVDWSNPNARIDNYVLVLSWSPEYCARFGNGPKQADQCRNNHFEFIVHGLWPQSDQAKDKFDHPRFCTAAGRIDEGTLRKHFCTMPDANLMQEEWSKHGTCAFKTPAAYLQKIDELFHALRTPDMRRISDEKHGNPTAGDIVRAFVKENGSKGLKENNLVVWVAKGNFLREIVVCYDKNFALTACTVKGTPVNQKIRVAF